MRQRRSIVIFFQYIAMAVSPRQKLREFFLDARMDERSVEGNEQHHFNGQDKGKKQHAEFP
jgi:hypothetical protein